MYRKGTDTLQTAKRSRWGSIIHLDKWVRRKKKHDGDSATKRLLQSSSRTETFAQVFLHQNWPSQLLWGLASSRRPQSVSPETVAHSATLAGGDRRNLRRSPYLRNWATGQVRRTASFRVGKSLPSHRPRRCSSRHRFCSRRLESRSVCCLPLIFFFSFTAQTELLS